MKIEYIIETIKVALAEVEWNYPFDYTLAFEETIKLLEKQKPKKPKTYLETGYGYWTWKCPNCGDEWLFRYNYCSSCGQRLDWSEEYA